MSDLLTARQRMVDCQVRPSDVTDLRIIEAMLAIPREAFVPTNQRALAYLDRDIDVGTVAGRDFLIQPAVLAKMIQAAEVAATDRVLVTGSATGYAAAVMARLAADVFAVASSPDMAANARAALSATGAGKVAVSAGAAGEGDPANGPYDVILLNGATEIVPEALYQQLKIGGRLVGVFADVRPSRAVLVTRSPSDYGTRTLFDAVEPTLPGLERVPAFSF